MLELLQPEEGDRILDVGSGSGWTTALLSHIVGSGGRVFGVEIVPELVKLGKRNIAKYSLPNVEIREAGKTLGIASEAPFGKILVSAADQSVPAELVDQLRLGGRMVIPVGGAVLKIEKSSKDSYSYRSSTKRSKRQGAIRGAFKVRTEFLSLTVQNIQKPLYIRRQSIFQPEAPHSKRNHHKGNDGFFR